MNWADSVSISCWKGIVKYADQAQINQHVCIEVPEINFGFSMKSFILTAKRDLSVKRSTAGLLLTIAYKFCLKSKWMTAISLLKYLAFQADCGDDTLGKLYSQILCRSYSFATFCVSFICKYKLRICAFSPIKSFLI